MRDSINSPSHYTVYPIETIEITRHLGFCLGNAVKYVLRAPYKGGVEDCLKAQKYLEWAANAARLDLSRADHVKIDANILELVRYLAITPGDRLWDDISREQWIFLLNLLSFIDTYDPFFLTYMDLAAGELRRILGLRDTIGQIYEGMTGLPDPVAGEDG